MSARPRRIGVIGLGAAACAACCAGPLIALLGGLGVLTLVSGAVFGLLAAALVVVAGLAWVTVRHRRKRASAPSPGEPVSVAPPTRRPR